MSAISLIKNILIALTLSLLAPLAANATNEAWDSSSSGPIGQGWALSNGNLTATSPNTGPTQSTTANGNINGQFASQSIPTGQKSYFEITVNTASASGTGSNTKWYYLQTAFCVGVGEHGLSYGTINGNDIGAIINPATYIQYGYNRGVSNSGYVIYAPEAGEVAPGSPIDAPPSAWVPGDVIGIAVDRQDNPATVTFYHNGVSDGGAFNISGIPTNAKIYPCLQSWWLEGPTATINGGNSGAFKHSVPSGYTALDTLNGGTPPPTPPAAPSGLTASASGTQINLSWSASSGATSYSVYRGTTSGGESTTAIASGLTTTSYVNTGLANGTYYYKVTASNSGGASGYSNEASATVTAGGGSLPSGWTDGDVGTPGATGSASYNSSTGVFTVNGSGGNITGVSDDFNLAYEQITGNCTIMARVTSVQNTSTAADAGVMIRETLANTSSEASVYMTAGNGVAYINRPTDGGTGTLTNPKTGVTAPYWVEVVRSGTTLTSSYAPDVSGSPGTWTSAGSVIISTLGSSAYVGLGVCSNVTGTLCTATFDHVSVTSGSGSAPATPTGLTAVAGNASVALSWTASSGATSYNVERSTTSGGPYTTINSPTGTSYTDPTAANGTTYYYVVSATNSSGTSANSSQVSATPSGGTAPAAPSGLTASASGTQINLSWSASSGATSYSVYRGTTSGGESTTAIVSGLTTTSYVNTGLASGTYYYKVTASNSSGTSGYSNEASATVSTGGGSLPSGQTDADIGGPSPTGSGSYNTTTNTYTLVGGGANIWGTADQFNYLYESGAGDETIVARVTGMSGSNLNGSAKAGIMFRNTTDAGSVFVDVDYLPSSTGVGRVEFLFRTATGASASYVPGVNVNVAPLSTSAPVWIKLVKSGSTFTGYYSTSVGTPASWSTIGTTTVTLNASYLTGLDACSVNNGTAVTDSFDNVQFGPVDQDIGGPSPAGSGSYTASSGVCTLTGGGTDIWGTADQFNYFYDSGGSGNETIVVRVTGLSGSSLNASAKAGIMFRNTTDAGSVFVDIDYLPSSTGVGRVEFLFRTATGASASYVPGVNVNVAPLSTSAPVWLMLVKSGTTFTGYYSTSVGTPASTGWNTIGTTTVTLNSVYLTGLDVCSHNNGTPVTGTFDNVDLGMP